jgi:hypothetical protein
VIQDVDATLERLLAGELAAAAPKEGFQVTFGPPTDADEKRTSKPRVNLYLHDVRENLDLRDESFHVSRKPGENEAKRFPGAVTMDLSYLVTVHSDGDPVAEHKFLSDVLGVLFRARSVPEKYLAESLRPGGPNAMSLTVAQPDHPAHNDPPSLWQALGGRLRPTLGLVVTARFNPFETSLVRLVREAIVGLGQGVSPSGPQRPLSIQVTRVTAAGIISAPGGEPLGGATVSVRGRDEKAGTDERGFFYILDLPPGKHTLQIARRGYRDAEVAVMAPPPGRQDLLEPVGISLQPLADAEAIEQKGLAVSAAINAPQLVEAGRTYAVSLTGRLKLSDGRPAAYIPVRVGERSTTTDGEGFYTFHNLSGSHHTVIADVPGHGEVEISPSSDGAATVPLGTGKAQKAERSPAN